MRTINDEWQDYLNAVLPKNACDIQIRETRYAFIAGAFTILQLMRTQPDRDAIECADDCEKQMALLVAQRLQRNE